jgi:hypothetical protein
VIALMALFMPLRKSMTLTPAATALHPSVRIACVSTVAQVVPVAWMSVCEEGVELDKRLGLLSWLGAYPLVMGMSYPT